MLRRLLACLALITGLAAIGAPTHASITEAVRLEAGSGIFSSESATEDRNECPDEASRAVRRDPGKAEPQDRRNRRIIKPPVLFGVDRAYE